MHIFNTICPRPHPSSSRTHCTHVKHSASSSSASSVSDVTIPPSLNTETSHRSEEIKGKGKGKGRSFLDYFRNISKRSQSKEENCADNKQADFAESSSTTSSSSSSSSLLEDSSVHSGHVDDSAPLLVGDYGPAQYGISDASWYLLIMARRCTEEVRLDKRVQYSTLQYTIFHSTVLYCTALYCIAPYCTALYSTLYSSHDEKDSKPIEGLCSIFNVCVVGPHARSVWP